jgi:hypothetical protein
MGREGEEEFGFKEEVINRVSVISFRRGSVHFKLYTIQQRVDLDDGI